MACERDRIINLTDYIKSFGIEVNIGKNKARGNNGYFKFRGKSSYRIDVSKNLSKDKLLAVLLHEFAHFIHYNHDSSLKSLDFIFDDFSDVIKEELIRITVLNVPKETAENLYKNKNEVHKDITELHKKLKVDYPNLKLTSPYFPIEKTIKIPFNYLIKYDRVKYFNSLLSVKELNKYNLSNSQQDYINLKSKQRKLKRINSRISALNRYYNQPSELFARFIEMYITDINKTKTYAPETCKKVEACTAANKIPELTKLIEICSLQY